MFSLRSFLLPILAACPLLAAAADPHYQLRFFSPDNFDAKALNNRGQVLGMVSGTPTIWSSAGTVAIPIDGYYSACRGLNDNADLACYVVNMADGTGGAAGYISGALQLIHPLLPQEPEPKDFYSSFGVGIGNDGTVVGTASPMIGDRSRAFVYRNGQVTLLAPFDGSDFWTEAFGVSSDGSYTTGDAHVFIPGGGPWETHAFRYHNGEMLDIGTLGGYSSVGYAVNNAGQVVGRAETADSHAGQPFLYTDGKMIDLGSLGGIGGIAYGINNAGWVVGESAISIDNPSLGLHGFVYHHGKMTDLNKLVAKADGWVITSAQSINDANQILARACRDQGCRAVLLVPREHGPNTAAADKPAVN